MSGIRIAQTKYLNLKDCSKPFKYWKDHLKESSKEREKTEMSVGQIVNSINYLENELDLIINKKGSNLLSIIEDIQRFPMNITSKVWILSKLIKQGTFTFPPEKEIVTEFKSLHKSIFETCEQTEVKHKKEGISKKLFIQLLETLIRYRNSVAHNPLRVDVDFKENKCTGILTINKANGKGKVEMESAHIWSQVECLHHIVSGIMRKLINQ